MGLESQGTREARSSIVYEVVAVAVDSKGLVQRRERRARDVIAGDILCGMVTPAARSLSSRRHSVMVKSEPLHWEKTGPETLLVGLQVTSLAIHQCMKTCSLDWSSRHCGSVTVEELQA